jgi:hypothetical protein
MRNAELTFWVTARIGWICGFPAFCAANPWLLIPYFVIAVVLNEAGHRRYLAWMRHLAAS